VNILENSQIINVTNLHIISTLTLRGALIIIVFKFSILRTLDQGTLVNIVFISHTRTALLFDFKSGQFLALKSKETSLKDFMTYKISSLLKSGRNPL